MTQAMTASSDGTGPAVTIRDADGLWSRTYDSIAFGPGSRLTSYGGWLPVFELASGFRRW